MFDYPSITPDLQMEFSGDGLFFVFYAVYMLIMAGVSVGTYVFQSLGAYTIAKRRGIRKPWLAWVPVGNLWIFGYVVARYFYYRGKCPSY